MTKNEMLIKLVYDISTEMKLPIIDERVYDKVKIKTGDATVITFKFEEDEAVIRGFLGLAEYFHTVVIKDGDDFYIPVDQKIFLLKSA